LKKRTLSVVLFILMSVIISGCSVDLNSLLGDDTYNDYSFLNNDADDILDTGPVKSGVLNLFTTAPDTLNPILTSNAFVKDYSCF
jgi:peptide/nickel transport system substrate-binding protein